MKAFITEIRMELESSLYCVRLLSYLHFCVAEPAKPSLHKMHIMATDETLQGANMDNGAWAYRTR